MQRHLAGQGDVPASVPGTIALAHEHRFPVAAALSLRPMEDLVPSSTNRLRRVFDAGGDELLPGPLILDEDRPHLTTDPDAQDVFRGCGAAYDLLAKEFLRNSIDNRGMSIDASVHYGKGFANAYWNGRQLIFGDGDGRVFQRLTRSVDAVAHEFMHGVIQYSARLPYTGQAGAICEHLADAFGIMASQHAAGQTATQSNWLIGAGLFGPGIQGVAIRSMLIPGTAYDDKWLGRDPQPGHMHDYVHSPEDNGGVHINSGIPNRAFALAARELGGFSWGVLGRIWYRVLTAKLTPETTFLSFAYDTMTVARELYPHQPRVQHILAAAWAAVGLHLPAARNRVALAAPSTTSTTSASLERRATS
jgi:Zn-dependent metalloprotease